MPDDQTPQGTPPGPPPELPGSRPGPPPPPMPPTPYNQPGAFAVLPPLASSAQPNYAPAKPALVTALGILTLSGGILSVLWGLGAALTLCFWIPWIAEFGGGVWGIVVGAQMLNNERVPPNRIVAILFMVGLLDCNIFSFTIGLLILIFMANPEVKNYYESQGIGY